MTEHMVRFSLFLFLFTASLFAQRYPDPKVDSLLSKGISEILEEKYDKAEQEFILLNKEYPYIPLGNIYQAAVKISRAVDYKIDLNEDQLDSLFNHAEDVIDIYEDQNGEDLWYHYFVALVNGYKSYYNIEQKNYLEGMLQGIESIKSFEDCLDIDKNFSEAFVIIGNYLYWKSEKTEFINWFPLVDDNTEQGIKFLQRAVKEATYSKNLAVYTLTWVYINEKRYKEAVDLSKEILDDYPNNRFVKRSLASAYYYIDKQKSIQILDEIKLSLLNDKALNDRNKISLNYRIAKLYFEMDNFPESKKIVKSIINEFSSKQIDDIVVEQRLEQANKLLSKIENSK